MHPSEHCAVLWFSWKGSVTIWDPLAFGHLHVQHHHLHHQVHALSNDKCRLHRPGSDQGSAQDSSLWLYWDGVTSFPCPLVSGTSCSWKPSWERAKAQPISSTSQSRVPEDEKWRSECPSVRIEASWLPNKCSTLLTIASSNSVSRKMKLEFWRDFFCPGRLKITSTYTV